MASNGNMVPAATVGSAKKASAQWKLRMKLPEEFPNIAKFQEEGVKWDKALKPLKMYFKEEEIKEDEEEVVKDANYWRNRKHIKRRRYRKKSLLYLEDSTPKIAGVPYEGINYEGQVVSLSTAEFDVIQSSKSSVMREAKDDMLFKYVLLQFVKKPPATGSGASSSSSGGAMEQEINVIPVSDMFYMKKAVNGGTTTLVELEKRFEEEQRHKETIFAGYKMISRTLQSSEDQINRGKQLLNNLSNVGSYESSAEMVKHGRGRSSRGNDNTELLIGEDGVDVEENAEYDEWCKGDYVANHADDEEGQVDVEQARLNDMIDDEVAQAAEYDDDDGLDGESEDDEDDEEIRNEAERKALEERAGLDSDVIVFDDSMERTLEEARKVLDLGASQAAAGVKRGRDEQESGGGGARVSFGGDTATGTVKKGRPSITVAGATGSNSSSSGSAVSVSTGYELSCDGVRKYIIDRGGRVSINEITKVFEESINEYSRRQVAAGVKKGKKAGKSKFLDIVSAVANSVEDPLLGGALVLKQ